jgi:hypothetical protein
MSANTCSKNGKEVEGCFLRVERKRTKPTPESRVAGPQVIGTRLPDSGSRFPNSGSSRMSSSGSSRMPGRVDDARMYPSPLRPIKRPHRRFGSRVASTAAAPSTHRRMLSTTGLSQEELEFLKTHRPEGVLELAKVQPRPLPVPKLAVPNTRLDEVTPVQSPDKYPPTAESGNMVRFAPSPSTLPSHAGSSPIPLQIPAPPAEFSPPNLRAFKDRLAAGHSRVTAFSPAAELAAVRCEVAAEDKANGKGHRRAVSMFIITNNLPPLDLSESDDSTWRESGSSQDEQGSQKKKAKRGLIRRRHLSEENLKRNLLYQAKLKRTYASEENMRGRPISRETVQPRGKSGKSRKSDATERAPEGQLVVASQQAPEGQLIVAAQQPMYQPAMPYTHMVPQYPPPMPPMGYMPMQPQAMAPAPAPGGFTYMDMPHHPHPQFHEPIQMYPGPSHHQYAGPGPSQVPYPPPPHPALMHQGQPQVPFHGHHQREYHEPMHVSQDARNHPYQSHGRPQYQGRRHASYAHPQQMHYQGNYSSMPHSNFAPHGPAESYHQSRQRLEAERYRRYNS